MAVVRRAFGLESSSIEDELREDVYQIKINDVKLQVLKGANLAGSNKNNVVQ